MSTVRVNGTTRWLSVITTLSLCFSGVAPADIASLSTTDPNPSSLHMDSRFRGNDSRLSSPRKRGSVGTADNLLHIPPKLGRVVDSFALDGSPRAGQPLLYLQDAHAVYEVQDQIRKLIAFFHEEYGYVDIFLEGASGPVTPSVLAFSDMPEANEEFATHLMRAGDIGGAEAFGLSLGGRNNVRFWGVEDPALYRRHLQQYKAVAVLQVAALHELEELKKITTELMDLHIPPQAKEVFRLERMYHESQLELFDYAEELYRVAEKVGIFQTDQIEWYLSCPNLAKLQALLDIEDSLDRKKLAQEMAQIEALLLRGGADKTAPTILDITAYLDNEPPIEHPRRYFRELDRLANEAGVPLERFEQYLKWSSYLTYKDELDVPAFFEELEKLKQSVLDVSVLTEAAHAIVNLYQQLGRLDRLIRLKWGEEKEAPYEETATRLDPVLLWDGLKRWARHDRLNADVSIDTLVRAARAAHEFYRLAKLREKAFGVTLRLRIEEEPDRPMILITGGFHASGVTAALRKHHIPHMLIQPGATDIGDPGLYERLMRREVGLSVPVSYAYLALAALTASEAYLGNERVLASRLPQIVEAANVIQHQLDSKAPVWKPRGDSHRLFRLLDDQPRYGFGAGPGGEVEPLSSTYALNRTCRS